MARIPKTGMAKTMREWMRRQRSPFTRKRIWEALGVPPGPERVAVHRTVQDFITRGEICVVKACETGQDRRQQTTYRYNQTWKTGYVRELGRKIYKAIYLADSSFTGSAIQRLAEAPDRSYVTKILKKLTDEGHLVRVGKKPCEHGRGFEHLYRIAQRDRYRIEIL